MTIITAATGFTVETPALPLCSYAQIIRYSETAFFGINYPPDRDRACRKIWTKLERDNIARYILEAQTMIENELRYPLGVKWFVGEQHEIAPVIFTDWCKVIDMGIMATSDIGLGIVLDHTNDPATFAAIATTVTDEDQIHFYHPGTDVEIFPSSITLTGGTVTAEFPRARLVTEAKQDNPDTGWDYSDTTAAGAFEQTIDCKRVYNDPTQPGHYVETDECGCPMEDTEYDICYQIKSHNGGIIKLLREDTTCNPSSCNCGHTTVALINYCAGIDVERAAVDAILHLAHALAPIEPCPSCDPIRALWKQDRTVPEVMTRERINCIFGVQEGAYRAMSYTNKNRHLRMALI